MLQASDALIKALRKFPLTGELDKFSNDIWITNKPVPPHIDSTADDMLVYGFILINEGYALIHNKIKLEIPTNGFYRIDAKLEHYTVGSGILAVLIWDMPNWTLDDFKFYLLQDERFIDV